MYSKHVAATAPSMPESSTTNMTPWRKNHSHDSLLQYEQQFRRDFRISPPKGDNFSPPGKLDLRRSIDDPNMLAYTERAKEATQRRYNYNAPAAPNGLTLSQTGRGFATSLKRSWGSLPHLNHLPDQASTFKTASTTQRYGEERRPQSDFIFSTPKSRPNSPENRPVSDMLEPKVSPRIIRNGFLTGRPIIPPHLSKPSQNVLVLDNEIVDVDDFIDDDVSEPELAALDSARRDGNFKRNSEVEIEPFPLITDYKLKSLDKTASTDNLKSNTKLKASDVPKISSQNIQGAKAKTKPAVPKILSALISHQTKPEKKVTPPKSRGMSVEYKKSLSHLPQYPEIEILPDRNPDVEGTVQPPIDVHSTSTKTTNGLLRTEKLLDREIKISSLLNEELKKARPTKESNKPKSMLPNSNGQLRPSDISISGNNVVIQTVAQIISDKPKISSARGVTTNKETIKSSADEGIKINSMVRRPSVEESNKKLKKEVMILPKQDTGQQFKAVDLAREELVPNSSNSSETVKNENVTPPRQDRIVGARTKKSDKHVTITNKVPTITTVKETESIKHDKISEDEEIKKEELPIRGVLKKKSHHHSHKPKKKLSVQFGENLIREVTKITYPWNLESSSSDSSSDSESDEESTNATRVQSQAIPEEPNSGAIGLANVCSKHSVPTKKIRIQVSYTNSPSGDGGKKEKKIDNLKMMDSSESATEEPVRDAIEAVHFENTLAFNANPGKKLHLTSEENELDDGSQGFTHLSENPESALESGHQLDPTIDNAFPSVLDDKTDGVDDNDSYLDEDDDDNDENEESSTEPEEIDTDVDPPPQEPETAEGTNIYGNVTSDVHFEIGEE